MMLVYLKHNITKVLIYTYFDNKKRNEEIDWRKGQRVQESFLDSEWIYAGPTVEKRSISI